MKCAFLIAKKIALKQFLLLLVMLLALTSAQRSGRKPKLLALTSVHIVDRNGFAETITNKDRLGQFQKTDFLKPQAYQKVLRIYERDSKGNVRSVVSSYHSNGNPKQFLEILNGRARGNYWEWHENGSMSASARVIGGVADITQAAEHSWLFDGISYAWDEEGHLLAQIPYIQGFLEGIAQYYHTNGQVWKRIPYHKNVVDGVVEIHKDSGEILQQITYCQGNKHGSSLRFWAPGQVASQEEYVQGKLESGLYFSKNGASLAQVKQGTGYRATFGKDSINELQEYKRGILEGEVRVYTPQGGLRRIYHVKDNVKHGEEVEYYDVIDNGKLLPKISFYWYEGKIHGLMKTWYSNGNFESQRELSNNLKNGIASFWYRDGNLMMIEEYEQNKLIRGDYFKPGEKVPFSQVVQGKGVATIFDAEGHFVSKVSYLNGRPDE
jgi:antitoxin component YwqK of YwqJK toxin-antitoxin module